MEDLINRRRRRPRGSRRPFTFTTVHTIPILSIRRRRRRGVSN